MFKIYGEFWKKYAKFSGRTNRKSFWLTMLINTVIMVPLAIFAFGGEGPLTKIIPYLIFFYATLIPFIAICRRRLRDAGYTGKAFWWWLLPYAGWIVFIVKLCKPSVPEEQIPQGAEIPVLAPAATATRSNATESQDNDGVVTVMAGSNYRPAAQQSNGGNIFGLLVSIGLILGGLSGNFVLRGTESSVALVVAGVVFLVFDIIKIVSTKKENERADSAAAQSRALEQRAISEAASSEPLPQQVTVHLFYDEGVPALNYGASLNGKEMEGVAGSESRIATTLTKRNVLNLSTLNLTAVMDIDGSAGSDVYIRLFKQGTSFGIALPTCISLVEEGK